MMAHWAKFVDWLIIQGAAHRPPPARKLDEAVQFLQGPDFIPAESEPAQIQFNSHLPTGNKKNFSLITNDLLGRRSRFSPPLGCKEKCKES